MVGITKITWGVISTVLVGLFVGYQYFDSKWKARIERSLNYAAIYQQPEKVAARNASDLWPPIKTANNSEIDPHIVARLIDAFSDPSFAGQYNSLVEQYIAEVKGLDDPDAVAQFGQIRARRFLEDVVSALAGSGTAGRSRDGGESDAAEQPALVGRNECESSIKAFVDTYLDQNYKEEDLQKEIVDGGFVTPMGTLIKIDSKKYWSLNGIYYHYTWPALLREFFVSGNSKVCADLVDEIEVRLSEASPDILNHLHDLKHFYAAVSICAKSGLCDALVACEIFHGDMARFEETWKQYFEVWAASRGEVEYWRLPEFGAYCFSNGLFVKYSQGSLNWYQRPMLYVRSFTNFW